MSYMTVDAGGGREERRPINYPANSKRAREAKTNSDEKPKMGKIITGEAIQRRKKFGRLGSMFMVEDTQTVGQFVLLDVIVPAIKNLISETVSQGIDRILFGEGHPRSTNARPGSYINYSKPSSGVVRTIGPNYRDLSRTTRSAHNFNEIILTSRAEAEDVIEQLRDRIREYQVATVADLYDLIGAEPEYTAQNWGWYDLRGAKTRLVRDGYILELPKTVDLE